MISFMHLYINMLSLFILKVKTFTSLFKNASTSDSFGLSQCQKLIQFLSGEWVSGKFRQFSVLQKIFQAQ